MVSNFGISAYLGKNSISSAFKFVFLGAPVMAQWLTNLTRNHEVAGLSQALLGGLRIQHCCEVWCGSQTQLGSGVAVALA